MSAVETVEHYMKRALDEITIGVADILEDLKEITIVDVSLRNTENSLYLNHFRHCCDTI